MTKKFLSITIIILSLNLSNSFGQNKSGEYSQTLGQELNAITTSVPFLMIAPDSRSGSMGDAGVALSPDGYSQHWNSSKLAFVEQAAGITISYTPWLKDLVDDMSLAYVSGFYKYDENQTFGGGLRYFSMGSIAFTEDGENYTDFSPNEFAIDLSYNRKLSDHFALGIAPRFIYSNLAGTTEGFTPGKTGAFDVNGYYNNKLKISDYKGSWAAGFNISNIGAKLGYSESSKNFIPTNLRLGGSMSLDLDQYNSLTATLDLNKLLVPTPPIYYPDGDTLPDGITISDGTDKPENIALGMDPDVGVGQGMVQSFYDAPRGFEEEMEEISYAFGLEYWYAKQFAVRGGYFYEHENKGNRKYFTAGIGLKMNVFGLDFSYLIPAGNFNNSPLSNTWRFSLVFDFEGFKNQ